MYGYTGRASSEVEVKRGRAARPLLKGIAVGGALPLVFSLTGDMFAPSSRSHASAAVARAHTRPHLCST